MDDSLPEAMSPFEGVPRWVRVACLVFFVPVGLLIIGLVFLVGYELLGLLGVGVVTAFFVALISGAVYVSHTERGRRRALRRAAAFRKRGLDFSGRAWRSPGWW